MTEADHTPSAKVSMRPCSWPLGSVNSPTATHDAVVAQDTASSSTRGLEAAGGSGAVAADQAPPERVSIRP